MHVGPPGIDTVRVYGRIKADIDICGEGEIAEGEGITESVGRRYEGDGNDVD